MNEISLSIVRKNWGAKEGAQRFYPIHEWLCFSKSPYQKLKDKLKKSWIEPDKNDHRFCEKPFIFRLTNFEKTMDLLSKLTAHFGLITFSAKHPIASNLAVPAVDHVPFFVPSYDQISLSLAPLFFSIIPTLDQIINQRHLLYFSLKN